MAAVTTLSDIGPSAYLPSRRVAPRVAIPRERRRSSTTYLRRRLVAAALVLGALVVAGQAGVALGGSSLAAPERTPTVYAPAVIVRSGDTLWSIVARLAPGEDPRPLVDELSAARQGAPLIPGQVIRLPS